MDFTHYNILGVTHSASSEEIDHVYRQLLDRLPEGDDASEDIVAYREKANTAYSVLQDPQRREEYDASLTSRPMNCDVKLTLSRSEILPLEEDQVLYALVEVASPEAVSAQADLIGRLNLTVVLDHSYSMAGKKIERAKTAIRQLINGLTAQDRLSLVTVNHEASVMSIYALN